MICNTNILNRFLKKNKDSKSEKSHPIKKIFICIEGGTETEVTYFDRKSIDPQFNVS